MMKFLLILFCLILLACSNEAEVETMSFEDLVGETGPAESVDTTTQTNLQIVPSTIGAFINSQLSLYDTTTHSKTHSIDRFGYSSFQKIEFRGKKTVPYGKTNMVTPVADLFLYTFIDTLKTKNAFYNWLDCFGSDCNAVKLNEDIDAIKTPPMFTLMYDTCIVAVEYLCEHQKNDWKSFQDSIISKFGKNYLHRIDVRCGGPLVWSKQKKP